jgi:hypothetical protein
MSTDISDFLTTITSSSCVPNPKAGTSSATFGTAFPTNARPSFESLDQVKTTLGRNGYQKRRIKLERIVRLEYLTFALACLFGLWGVVMAVLILFRKGPLYRSIKPTSRPRRWVLFLLLYLVVCVAGWLGVSALWPGLHTRSYRPRLFRHPAGSIRHPNEMGVDAPRG